MPPLLPPHANDEMSSTQLPCVLPLPDSAPGNALRHDTQLIEQVIAIVAVPASCWWPSIQTSMLVLHLSCCSQRSMS
eukprot:12152234-Prorocentrum_lima.AAC.1